MKKSLTLACLVALSSLSASAMAGQAFVRGELGRSDVRLKVDGVGSVSDKDGAFSVRGGYWFNSNFALEGNYSQFYDEPMSIGAIDYDSKLSSFGIGAVYKQHAFSDDLGYFVQLRGGIARGKMEIGSDSESSTKPYYGIGAGYDFTRNLGLSLNYDHNQGSTGPVKITTNTLSLGLEARF